MLAFLRTWHGGKMNTHRSAQIWISRLLALVLLLGPGLSLAEMANQHCHESNTPSLSAVADVANVTVDADDCCCEQGLTCDMDAACVTVCSLLSTHAVLQQLPWQVDRLLRVTARPFPTTTLPHPFPANLDRPPRSRTA